MKVLIVGNSFQNAEISSYFEKRGDIVSQTRASDLINLKGCIGDFTAKLKAGTEQADILILAELPGIPVTGIFEGNHGGKLGRPVHSIFAENKMSLLPQKEKTEPIVFLLDYFEESFISEHIAALKDAKMLAGQKRKVYFVSKFVRTACPGGEALYEETRAAGVTFIKYEGLSINYDFDSDKFTLNVNDGVLDTIIETSTIFTADKHEGGSDFNSAVKALRIKADEKGYVNEAKHFLTPVLTSRRGVYHISRDNALSGIVNALDSIANDAFSIDFDYTKGAMAGKEIISVEGEKCVYCYSCYRACTHAAMEPDNNTRVMKNYSKACQGCGICVSVCPGNALSFAQSDDILAHKSVLAQNKEKRNKILALCCENSAAVAMEKMLSNIGDEAKMIDFKSIPCGGSVGLENITDALTCYDKVVVAVCVEDACKHFDGNKRACAQENRLKQLLEQAGIDSNRVGYITVSPVMPGVLKDEIVSFIKGEA